MSLRDTALQIVFPKLYRAFSLSKVNPRSVLFIEFLREDLDPSYRLLYEELDRRGDLDIELISTQRWKGALSALTGHVGLIRDIAKAGTVFLRTDSSIISALPIRSQTKVVQLWHACGAFKRFGLSTVDKGYGASREEFERHPPFRNLKLVTVSSQEIVWAYEEAMGLAGQDVVKPLGISRTDVFFDQGYMDRARTSLKETFPGIGERQVILYAPTFRGETRQATAPDALDIPLLRKRLGDKYALVIKHHPVVRQTPPVPRGCEDFAFEASATTPVDDLLAAADVCVTDYSSIVFEWSLLGRPIAFFAFDLDDYLDERGFYYDYETMTPGPVCATTEELAAYVQSLAGGFDTSEVDAFRERFMGACDGHATERIVREVFGS